VAFLAPCGRVFPYDPLKRLPLVVRLSPLPISGVLASRKMGAENTIGGRVLSRDLSRRRVLVIEPPNRNGGRPGNGSTPAPVAKARIGRSRFRTGGASLTA
jgi:hypothetical protein